MTDPTLPFPEPQAQAQGQLEFPCSNPQCPSQAMGIRLRLASPVGEICNGPLTAVIAYHHPRGAECPYCHTYHQVFIQAFQGQIQWGIEVREKPVGEVVLPNPALRFKSRPQ